MTAKSEAENDAQAASAQYTRECAERAHALTFRGSNMHGRIPLSSIDAQFLATHRIATTLERIEVRLGQLSVIADMVALNDGELLREAERPRRISLAAVLRETRDALGAGAQLTEAMIESIDAAGRELSK